jgi:5S rRNA maturation endonuclease (ribonuclease M5)
MTKYNITEISKKITYNINKVLDHFGLQYSEYVDHISLPCPIHNGDNPFGLSIYKKGVGNWLCFTHQCHMMYGTNNGASIVHLVQALLNSNFYTALKWCADLVGEKLDQNNNSDNETITKFIHLCKYLNKSNTRTQTFTPRESISKFLKIPAQYYINRGYSESVLCKFDVGYCFSQNKSFFDRVITPFYDDNGRYMIGYSGRNKNEKCPKCNLFHLNNTRCPLTKQEKMRATKWKHSNNFNASSYLYNYWNAKKSIQDNYTAILVEGAGDVWRLEEAGIYNSLGLLGARLSQNQKIILEESGAINLLIATDNDNAGEKAANSITQQCKNMFNIKKIQYPTKDPGSLTVEQIKQIFIPILERI